MRGREPRNAVEDLAHRGRNPERFRDIECKLWPKLWPSAKMSTTADTAWTCSACTYVHEEPAQLTLKRCDMCDTPRAAAARHEPDTTASDSEEEEDDNDDAYNAFDEPSAPDDGDRAEKRKRAQQEHAFEEQETALAKQFAGNGQCGKQG